MARQPRSGDLRHLLNFQKRGDGNSGIPGDLPVPGAGPFETVFQAAAKLVPARGGSETIIAGRLAGRQAYYCTFRNHALARTVDASWQVADARTGKVYQVESPISDADQRGQWLDMIVQEGPVS